MYFTSVMFMQFTAVVKPVCCLANNYHYISYIICCISVVCLFYVFWHFICFLPARRYAIAGLCDSDVSVCPSVGRLSHAGIVPSRTKAGS